MTRLTPPPSSQLDQRALLRQFFDAAVAAAQPALCLPAHLPPPPKGRTIVIGAGKASAAMARVNESEPNRGSAHFSDRGHLFQADRGRRFRAIVDAQGSYGHIPP